MRKLAWFLIILVAFGWALTIAGVLWSPVGDALHYLFIDLIGIGGANLIVGALTGLCLWGSVSGLQAIAVLAGTLIVGGVFWVCIKKFLWDRRPSILKSAESKIYQHEPAAALPQVTPEPVPKQIEKKEEAVAS